MKGIFRPVYGEHFEVRPKRWWSPEGAETCTPSCEDGRPLRPQDPRGVCREGRAQGDLWRGSAP